MELTGIIPPMVTPVVDKSGEIDTSAAKSLTRFLVEDGVHALFPAGSIGEFPSLTRDQRRNLITTVVEGSNKLPVLAGCGGTSLSRVRMLVSDAEDAGADVAVVVTPYYFNASQDGLCLFYETLADDADLPIVLYNIPQLTGQQLARDSVARLAVHSNIVGLKDSSRDFEYFANLTRRVPDSFSLLQGSPELAIPALDIGADGLVPGPSNVMPRTLVDLYESHVRGERERTLNILQKTLIPFIDSTRPIPSAPAFKYLLTQIGYDVGKALMPLNELTDFQKTQLDSCYHEILKVQAASD